MSLNTLKKLIHKELSNMALEYQNKFDIILSNIGQIYENGISAFSCNESER